MVLTVAMKLAKVSHTNQCSCLVSTYVRIIRKPDNIRSLLATLDCSSLVSTYKTSSTQSQRPYRTVSGSAANLGGVADVCTCELRHVNISSEATKKYTFENVPLYGVLL